MVRLLSTPLVMERQTTLRLSVIDDGPREHGPPRSGRGLLPIHRLADGWGTRQ